MILQHHKESKYLFERLQIFVSFREQQEAERGPKGAEGLGQGPQATGPPLHAWLHGLS